MKTCPKCNKSLPISAYHVDRSKKDGVASSCKECKNSYRKKYYYENVEKLKAYASNWYKKKMEVEPEKVRNQSKLRMRKHRAENTEKVRRRNAEWMLSDYQARYKSDPAYTSSRVARRTLHNALRNLGVKKDSSSWDLLGYTDEQFRCHIENMMSDGMSWGNFGKWHIDHIKPVSAFIKEGETDPKIINALDNLQPLWAKENLSKGAKYES